jgi:hypothetical protein
MSTLGRYLAHFAASLLDTFAAITGLYYSKKYAAIAKRLGLRPQAMEDDNRPGLIIIQIDGLAHAYLQQAMNRRRVPRIRRMLERGGFVLWRWRCGLPSSTPAAQAGIMFGDNAGIPAFRWYDKSLGRSVVCKLPGTAAFLERRAAGNRPGIVTAGSSYVNFYDGGASSSLFTVTGLHPRRLFEGVRGAGLVALFLLNPLRVVRVLYLALKEYVTDALQRVSSRIKGQSYLPFLGIFPFLRIFSQVIFREIETFAVLVDIYRGIPAVYASYFGYDEIAHHFGVKSMAAYQALHDIDQCIGQIERLRRVGLSRPYVLCILSDHGLTPSEPFVERYGHTLGQYISEQLGDSINLLEHAGAEYDPMYQTRFLLDELKGMEQSLGPSAAKVARRIRLLVQRRLRRTRELPQWDMKRQHDVVVKSSGSLAHVYFNISRHRMDLSEVSAAFPGLVVKLLAHAGIWLIVSREGEQTLIMAQDGILTLDRQGQAHNEGTHPLSPLPDPLHAAEQIRRIAGFGQSGDLILFGAYDSHEDVVVCFEAQWASHGGLGGAQDYPFIIVPRQLNWDFSGVRNAVDLYPFFASQRDLMTETQRAGEAA